MAGVDSAIGPTFEQARAVSATGVSWWGWYVGLPDRSSAYHLWTPAEIRVLAAAGFELTVPIFVPRMIGGRIDPASSPEGDADLALYLAAANGWEGMVALDTEESMRGDPLTAEYERRFGMQVKWRGAEPATYAGGFTFGDPPVWPAWWIWPGVPPAGQARQWDQGQFGGLDVDFDHAGAGFPLAHRAA